MAHCRLLFVGGRTNLQKIFDDTTDSSSESAAEMTIGADWIADYDFISEEKKKLGITTDDFTKETNPELYQDIINGYWYACYDVRNTKHYGSFDCINCPDFEPYDGIDWREKEKRNKIRAIEVIKTLPADTLFHFADSHW
ncbi:hypothetical protein J6O48_14070 [bacterium]|nr:hypothetical protein [bacterium]